MSQPDFFMSSSEMGSLANVRACFVERSISNGFRDDLLITRIEPGWRFYDPLNDCDMGAFERVIIALRSDPETFPYKQFPKSVYVLLPKKPFTEIGDSIARDDYVNAAWAEIYATRQAADAGLFPR